MDQAFPTAVSAAVGAMMSYSNNLPLWEGAILLGSSSFLAQIVLPLITQIPGAVPVFLMVPPALAAPIAAGATAVGLGAVASYGGYRVGRMGPVMHGVWGAGSNLAGVTVANKLRQP